MDMGMGGYEKVRENFSSSFCRWGRLLRVAAEKSARPPGYFFVVGLDLERSFINPVGKIIAIVKMNGNFRVNYRGDNQNTFLTKFI